MKALRDLRPSDSCLGPIGTAFYVVRASLAFVNVQAVHQYLGMHQFFGGRAGAALVENFAPAAADAVTVAGDRQPELMSEFVICNRCYLDKPLDLPMLAEAANARRRKAEEGVS